MKKIRIGAGAGYSGDRIEPAAELAHKGKLDYLVFECLGERTIALAQTDKLKNPDGGFDPLLEERMQAVLPACAAQGVKIVTNMGAANPEGAARAVVKTAKRLGLKGLKVAAVVGDDVLEILRAGDFELMDGLGRVATLGNAIVSANAYLDAEGIVTALDGGADVVITGRVCDPSLFLAPMIHAFGWAPNDWDKIGKGVAFGHLLECAGQVAGGYFADPGFKDVANLARLGFPLAEVSEDGSGFLTKVEGSGGKITLQSCREQLLYEIFDPSTYVQGDVIADFSKVTFTELGPDRIKVAGATGCARPDTLKVTIGYKDGFIGEGQMSYAGPGAVARGRLALEIVRERLAIIGVNTTELRCDLIGVDAANLSGQPAPAEDPREVRIRVAGRTATLRDAERIGAEVETLYTNGPAGGGGATRAARPVIAAASTLIQRAAVTPRVVTEVVT